MPHSRSSCSPSLSSVFEQPQTTKKRGGRQNGRALRYAKWLRARPLTPSRGARPFPVIRRPTDPAKRPGRARSSPRLRHTGRRAPGSLRLHRGILQFTPPAVRDRLQITGRHGAHGGLTPSTLSGQDHAEAAQPVGRCRKWFMVSVPVRPGMNFAIPGAMAAFVARVSASVHGASHSFWKAADRDPPSPGIVLSGRRFRVLAGIGGRAGQGSAAWRRRVPT